MFEVAVRGNYNVWKVEFVLSQNFLFSNWVQAYFLGPSVTRTNLFPKINQPNLYGDLIGVRMLDAQVVWSSVT